MDDLIHRLAHDLRAPLRSVSSAAAWIVEDLGRDAPPDLKTSVEILDTSVRRMERMLEVLLSMARASERRDTEETFDAAAELKEITLEGLDLEVHDSARLVGDRHAFEAAARELLDNAVLHAESERVKVTVTFESTDEGVWIRFLDDGPGMSDYVRENALRLFYSRFGASDAEHVGGGFSIAAAHAEANGGALELGPVQPKGAELRLKWKKA